MSIKRGTCLADLISGAGLIGSSPVAAQEAPSGHASPSASWSRSSSRPQTAPASRTTSQPASRQLSRNTSLLTGHGLTEPRQSDSAPRRSSTDGLPVQQSGHARGSGRPQSSSGSSGTLSGRPHTSGGEGTGSYKVDHWTRSVRQSITECPDEEANFAHADVDTGSSQAELQALLTQLAELQGALQGSKHAHTQQQQQHEQELQARDAQHAAALQKQFRELKTLEAVRDQALSGKRSAEHQARLLEKELEAVRVQVEQGQAHAMAVEEKLAASAKKLEQQGKAHAEALKKQAKQQDQAQQRLRQQLDAQDRALKDTEASLRSELAKRNQALFQLQQDLEGKSAAFDSLHLERSQLLAQVQELQLSRQTSFAPSAASQYGDAPCNTWLTTAPSQTASARQQEAHSEEPAAASDNIAAEASSTSTSTTSQAAAPAQRRPVNSQTRQPPPSISYTAPVVTAEAAAAFASSQWPPADWTQPAEGAADQSAAEPSPWPLLHRSLDLQGSQGRPQSAQQQRLRGQQQAVDVQLVQAQAQGQAQANALLQSLGAAHRELADVREEYAQRLKDMEASLSRAEAAQRATTSGLDAIVEALVQRCAAVLNSRASNAPLPWHRPQSAHTAGSSSSSGAGYAGNSPATASAAGSVYYTGSGAVGGAGVNSSRPASASARSQSPSRPQSPSRSTPSSRPSTAAAGGGAGAGMASSSTAVAVLHQMNERLAAENAHLMAELSKWQAGRHPAQKAASNNTSHSSQFGGGSSSAGAAASGVVAHGNSMPVREAVALAVKEALLAGKGDLLPALLTGSGAAGVSGGGWASSAGSRLEAALSAAEINIKLRTKVLELESELVNLRAEHAADDTQLQQQRAQLAAQEKGMREAQAMLQKAQDEKQDLYERLQITARLAAAATAGTSSSYHIPLPSGNSGSGDGGASSSSTSRYEQLESPGREQSGANVGVIRQELSRQRSMAAAAKSDKEVRDRQLQQLQDAHAALHTKLLEARQQLARRDAAVLQLRQHLAQAQMQMMDHGIEWKGGSAQQHLEPAPSAKQGLETAGSCQLQGMGAESSSQQQQQQQRSERRSTTDQLTAVSVTAGPLSFTAAMDAREREREVRRLDAECKAADEKMQGLQKEVKRLTAALSRQQLASDRALQLVQDDMRSRRESLAGDLEGATGAMQEAARKLTSSEEECRALRQELLVMQRGQQALVLDCQYLRARMTEGGGVARRRARLAVVQALSITIAGTPNGAAANDTDG